MGETYTFEEIVAGQFDDIVGEQQAGQILSEYLPRLAPGSSAWEMALTLAADSGRVAHELEITESDYTSQHYAELVKKNWLAEKRWKICCDFYYGLAFDMDFCLTGQPETERYHSLVEDTAAENLSAIEHGRFGDDIKKNLSDLVMEMAITYSLEPDRHFKP